ncbi:aldehyde dehydrogenase family protein [Paracoccus spongiarum]|uniref:Aldehyde dehydrogenase family protein n=1 Tax=Paracoccus spongiarum TaxID=3064387 RepID=A0ABT9J9F7_9RHOB|nr:aldehyde dehydrogenase family protein [Paracoccus sp. 2205BS29-5]MDP5306463.1 aldehyde dehydrogenase family protein [Paracoccus sp. 2205BS29-5]
MTIAADPVAAASQGVFIDNQWRPSASGATIEVSDPATGAVFARIAAGNAADIDAAVSAARRARAGAWGALDATGRGRILSRAAGLVLAEAEALARLESRDTGKPLAQARADIAATARYLEFYGGAADKVHGDMIPFLPGHFVTTEHVPFGVTGHIIPWNYPAQMFGRTIAAALAMGNACVLKPAEDACLTPLRLVEILRDAGLPAGALNCVPGRGEVAGAALCAHRGVDFLSFTGSPEVGVAVQAAAAAHHIGCTLELGGKSPQIVFADADLDRAMPVILRAITQNAGQTCSAGARLLVEDGIAGTVIERLRQAFPALTAGLPGDDRDLGPLISPAQLARVRGFCDRADADGIPLIAEGRIAANAPAGGNFIAPRAYGPVPRDHQLAREEVFGPVLSLMTFADEADAIGLANDTDYGLVAGVWSRDGSRAIRVARQIMVGQVFVNAYGAGGGIELPFGGMKKSGHGREKGFDALYEFAATRTMVIRHD